jgi:uncharacterized membrane protein
MVPAGSTQHVEEPVMPRSKAGRRRWYHPIAVGYALKTRPKIILAALVALVVAALLPAELTGPVRTTIAWNAGGLVYLALAARLMWTYRTEDIRKRAAQHDEGALVILAVILLAISLSFLAIGGVLIAAKGAHEAGAKIAYVGLAAVTILVSLTVTHVLFALHYAQCARVLCPSGSGQGGRAGARVFGRWRAGLS